MKRPRTKAPASEAITTPSRIGKPAAREAASARERLLQRAAELFAEHGFAHVGIQQIAEVSGVTKGSLFWHFASKRELYVECVKETIRASFSVPHRIDATDPKERLHQYLEWVLPVMSSNRVVRRLILHIITEQDAELMRALMEGPFGESHVVFMQILRDLKLRHDESALSYFVFAIFALNDELLEIAEVWEPGSRKRVGGNKSMFFIETMIQSW